MCYYVIFTGSYFLHLVSSQKIIPSLAAKYLFGILLDFMVDGRNNAVAQTKPTKDNINKALGEDSVLLNYTFIEIEDCGGNLEEIDAVIELANLKKQMYDEVLIINGSNCYDEYIEEQKGTNVKVLNEEDAVIYIKENWN